MDLLRWSLRYVPSRTFYAQDNGSYGAWHYCLNAVTSILVQELIHIRKRYQIRHLICKFVWLIQTPIVYGGSPLREYWDWKRFILLSIGAYNPKTVYGLRSWSIHCMCRRVLPLNALLNWFLLLNVTVFTFLNTHDFLYRPILYRDKQKNDIEVRLCRVCVSISWIAYDCYLFSFY